MLIEHHHQGNVSEAARFTDVKQPTLHNILKGKYAPRADTFAKLMRAYGASLDSLFGRDPRADDDTFSSGFHAAIRLVRRELERLEKSLADGDLGPRGIATRDTPL